MIRFSRYFLLLTIQLIFLQVFSQDYWEYITTIPDSTQVRSMAIAPDGAIYVGMTGFDYSGGIYRSTDNALTWEYLALTGITVYTIEICPNGDIIAGIYNGMYKSTDGGDSWYEVYFEIENVTNIKALSNGYVFAGGNGNLHGILRSTDFGQTWDTNFVFPSYWHENLNELTVSPEGYIYAGTASFYGPGAIYRSENLGGTWVMLDGPFEFTQVYSIAFHPEGEMYVGYLGNGLFRYNFITGQWTQDLYNITPDDIVFVGNDTIFLGCNEAQLTMSGVLYSDDGGLNYNWLNSGINGGEGGDINNLYWHPDGRIYAQSFAMLRSFEPFLTDIKNLHVPSGSIAENSPNPFSSYTMIKWGAVEIDKFVQLTITNSRGNIVENTKIKNKGKYYFKPPALNPGVYFYSISGKNTNYTGKMVLVK